MKALEFMRMLACEKLGLNKCGMASGSRINKESAKNYFGLLEDIPGNWFDNHSYYFYFYGEPEIFFMFLPDTWRFFPIDAKSGVYVWEIDNNVWK